MWKFENRNSFRAKEPCEKFPQKRKMEFIKGVTGEKFIEHRTPSEKSYF